MSSIPPDQQIFTSELGTVIHEVARSMRLAFDQRAKPFGLTRAQWLLLAHVSRHDGIRQNALAEILDIEAMTLARTADRLEAAGFLRRDPDPTDRRANLLRLTDAALPLVGELRRVAKGLWAEALSGISPESERQVVDVLKTIKANLATARRGEECVHESSREAS